MAIIDPPEPEYFEESFPRDDVLLRTQRPAGLPPAVWTTETTHRDGQQGGLPLTTEQSLAIYDLFCRFTGRAGAGGRTLPGGRAEGARGGHSSPAASGGRDARPDGVYGTVCRSDHAAWRG